VKLVGESVARERIEHVGTYLASPELADDEDEAIRLAQIYAEGKGPTGDNWLQADDLSVSE
jgi:capsule polysaccharide export protein KpsE/RkpR